MMRFFIGAGVLVALLAAGILTGGFMQRTLEPLTVSLNQAGEEALEGRWDRADSLSRQAREYWQKNRRMLAALSDHAPMEQMEILFDQLPLCLSMRDEETFCLICSQLSRSARALLDVHRGSWENIL